MLKGLPSPNFPADNMTNLEIPVMQSDAKYLACLFLRKKSSKLMLKKINSDNTFKDLGG